MILLKVITNIKVWKNNSSKKKKIKRSDGIDFKIWQGNQKLEKNVMHSVWLQGSSWHTWRCYVFEKNINWTKANAWYVSCSQESENQPKCYSSFRQSNIIAFLMIRNIFGCIQLKDLKCYSFVTFFIISRLDQNEFTYLIGWSKLWNLQSKIFHLSVTKYNKFSGDFFFFQKMLYQSSQISNPIKIIRTIFFFSNFLLLFWHVRHICSQKKSSSMNLCLVWVSNKPSKKINNVFSRMAYYNC